MDWQPLPPIPPPPSGRRKPNTNGSNYKGLQDVTDIEMQSVGSGGRGQRVNVGLSGAVPSHLHTHDDGQDCLACVLEKQQRQLESMRHLLAHARAEADSLREQQERLEAEAQPMTPKSAALRQASLRGVGDSLSYYKEQVRQLKYSVAHMEASQRNTEELLREAIRRPPLPPPVPIKDSDTQTFGLEHVDIMVDDTAEDSEDTQDSDAADKGRSRSQAGGGFDAESRVELVSNIRAAVGQEVTAALQKTTGWLFNHPTTTVIKRDTDKDQDKKDTAALTLPRLQLTAELGMHPSEEIFYEMCAAVGQAHAANEQQAIQVNNSRSFWQLVDAGILEIDQSVIAQIRHHDILLYIAGQVQPVYYCNKPLGFVLSRVLSAIEESEGAAKRQEEAGQASFLGLLHKRRLDDSRQDDEIENPNYNQWLDLAKKLIVLLSRHTQCLQGSVVLFEYEDPRAPHPEPRKFAPLQFAVEHHLDEIVLQICDAQERLAIDYWNCGYGFPFHSALELGSERDNAIRYIIRAASTVADDRFGLLKPRDSDGQYPFYLCLMYAHNVPGAMDPLMDILLKRNFKLNIRWTGKTPTSPPVEWHLLQWAAYQGVDRVFRQTRTHPDFYQYCQSPVSGTQGKSPLHLACMSGSANVVEILCHEINQALKPHTASIWQDHPTPLHVAAQQCHFKCIQVLLTFAKDKWGWPAKVQEEKLFGKVQYQTKWLGNDTSFEYSVYSAALLTLVFRRHKLALEENQTGTEHVANDDEIDKRKKEVEVSNYQVKLLNEKHPNKLRSFAQTRIKKYFFPWLFFIGLVTFFAASESAWMSDFNFYSQRAIERHFTQFSYVSNGIERNMLNLDHRGDLIDWVYHVMHTMPETFNLTHTVPVGTTRLRQVIVANDSCEIGPTFFRLAPDGKKEPCAGAISSQRPGVMIVDWLFVTLLRNYRDSHDEYKGPLNMQTDAPYTVWRSESSTGEQSFESRLGFLYPGSGYVMELDWGVGKTYHQALEAFRGNATASSWLQWNARALFITSTLYNPATDYYVIMHWAFELPPYGGVFVQTRWRSLRLFKYHTAFDYFVLAVEMLLVVIVFIMLLSKLWEMKYILKGHFKGCTLRKSWSFFWGALTKVTSRSTNLLDIATIAGFLVVFSLRVLIQREAERLNSMFESHFERGTLDTGFYFPFQGVAEDYATKQSAIGIVLMLVYMKILVIVSLHRNVGPISIAIVQTLFNKRILYFGMILMLLLFSLAFAAYFAYGEFAPEFRSLFTA
eukprot:Sspe_Gene.14693::Locus_5091_Transcript_1_1_Confidence_1.000_Length_3878::g.14693::m.14693